MRWVEGVQNVLRKIEKKNHIDFETFRGLAKEIGQERHDGSALLCVESFIRVSFQHKMIMILKNNSIRLLIVNSPESFSHHATDD